MFYGKEKGYFYLYIKYSYPSVNTNIIFICKYDL